MKPLHFPRLVPVERKRDTRVGLLNPSFKYVNSGNTDLRATFERIRREMAAKGKA